MRPALEKNRPTDWIFFKNTQNSTGFHDWVVLLNSSLVRRELQQPNIIAINKTSSLNAQKICKHTTMYWVEQHRASYPAPWLHVMTQQQKQVETSVTFLSPTWLLGGICEWWRWPGQHTQRETGWLWLPPGHWYEPCQLTCRHWCQYKAAREEKEGTFW